MIMTTAAAMARSASRRRVTSLAKARDTPKVATLMSSRLSHQLSRSECPKSGDASTGTPTAAVGLLSRMVCDVQTAAM